jgi:hypothetical protein
MHRAETLPVTPAQWIEHSEEWRDAHLDQAPSAYLRRLAIEERARRERALQAATTTGRFTPWEVWARFPLLTRLAIVCSIVVAVVAIGAAAH